jgi:hypothetical protein
MMRYELQFTLLVAFALSLAGCDEVANPIQSNNLNPEDTVTIVGKRAIVLEDYTGQTCSNCPDATKTAKNLEKLYGSRLIVIAPHVGFFADPNPPDFPANFKTSVGNEIDQFFGINGVLPAGTVNRRRVNNFWKLSYPNWPTEVQRLVSLESPFSMTDTLDYDTSTRVLNLTVKIKVESNPGSGPFNLMVYYTEDSVLSPQLHKPPLGTVQNYYHSYMLRGSLNGTWGEALTVSSASVGQTIAKTFNFTLPAFINHRHVHFIPMVAINTSSNREILQARKIKLVP